VLIVITKAPTTTTTDLPGSVLAGSPVNITVTTTATSNGAIPTGAIQIYLNGSTPFPGSGTYTSGAGPNTGQLFMADTASAVLQLGSYAVTASYPGDDNYGSSASPVAALYVTDFNVSANPSPVTISAPGQTGTSTITVTPQYGFTGTVALSVGSGCPTSATCTFSPSSVTVGSTSAVTSALTITTTGSASTPPARQPRVPRSFRLPVGSLWLLTGLLALAVLLALPALRRRPAALLFAATLLLAGVWAACGGGGGDRNILPPPIPIVSLSPTSLTFISQNVGTTSAAQSVTLTNTGVGTLAITGISMAGTNAGDFSETNTCGNSVSAGANCSISVKFAPTATGTRSGSVSISNNASGSPHTIGLSGTGVQAATPAGTYPIVVNATFGGSTRQLTVNVIVQ